MAVFTLKYLRLHMSDNFSGLLYKDTSQLSVSIRLKINSSPKHNL